MSINEITRLDKFLSTKLNLSRSVARKIIKSVGVRVNKKVMHRPSLMLTSKDTIDYKNLNINILEEKCSQKTPSNIVIDVLYEDSDLLVLNKPPKLIVHKANNNPQPSVVRWLKDNNYELSTIRGEDKMGIVHRLDKPTTGALLIAKNNHTHKILADQFKNKSIGRYYISIITPPLKNSIDINIPLSKAKNSKLKTTHVDATKMARSLFVKIQLSKDKKSEIIATKLFTGRTHQIRAHLNYLSRYILGDFLYAPKRSLKVKNLMLHAYILYFTHPITKKLIYIKAPIFKHFQDIINSKFDKELLNDKILKDSIINSFDSFN